MEKRHQVFISSTFSDLKDERAEIIQALLELDCIPAGMELFPATTSGAWELIKGVIDDSDYYCLVVAGRYGTVDNTGISFTEKEYDYALLKGKPVLAFVHGDPESLAAGKSEKTEQGKKRLEEFLKKVETVHHRRTWKTAGELGGLVSRGIVNTRKTHPSEGWVRGKFAATEEMMLELANLRAKVAELTTVAVQLTSPTVELENLSSGSDLFRLNASVRLSDSKTWESKAVDVSWDEILRYVGPALMNECTEEEFLEKLRLCAYHHFKKLPDITLVGPSAVVILVVVIDRVKVQLQALGQMAPGTKRRAVSDEKRYWKLTEVGSRQLINAQALKKTKE